MMPDAAWGIWRRLYVDGYVEFRVLEIGKGGFSSPHVHHSKSNFFVVAKGRVTVKQWVGDGQEIAGELTAHSVPLVIVPEVLHQFVAVEDSLVYELSVAAPGEAMNADEIERHGTSGIKMIDDSIKMHCDRCGQPTIVQSGWTSFVCINCGTRNW